MHWLYRATAGCRPSAHAPLGKIGLCVLSAGVTSIFFQALAGAGLQNGWPEGKWKYASLSASWANSLGFADLLLMFC